MSKEEILSLAKKIITEEIEKAGFKVIEIILFGSRARGDEKPDSDWDFYVLINKEIEFKLKRILVGNITTKLIENKITADVLIQPQKVIKERENDLGVYNLLCIKRRESYIKLKNEQRNY